MPIVNVDLGDKLVNDQLGFNDKSEWWGNKNIYETYDAGASQTKINKNTFAKQHSSVPVEKIESEIKVKANSYVVIKRT